MEISGSRFSAPSTATSKSVTDALHPIHHYQSCYIILAGKFSINFAKQRLGAKNIPEIFALAYWECIY